MAPAEASDGSAPEGPIRVLVCDDHALFRRGLAIVLEDEDGIELVGEAADTDAAVAAARDLRPDVVLLDLRMPGAGGLAALGAIRREVPGARVLVLTVSDDDRDLFDAVTAGAAGYLLKEVSIEAVGDAVRGVAAGESQLSPAMTAKLLGGYRDLAGGRAAGEPAPAEPAAPAPAPAVVAATEAAGPPPARVAGLTSRERQVLAGIARGLTNRAIATELGIAENTVKNHVRAVLDKLGASSRTEAAAVAVRAGLADAGA